MRIHEDTKLDFSDVLIVPKRSELSSRKNVMLQRKFVTKHGSEFSGTPIIAANMATGNFKMLSSLAKHYMFTAIAKHNLEYWFDNDCLIEKLEFGFFTIGMSEEDKQSLINFKQFLDTKNENLNGIILSKHLKICIDIANGYSQKFAKYVSSIRELFPENVIMAGNVCTTEMTQELILSGADIIKCGIGPGCFIAGTLIKTILGLKSIENINLNDYALTHKGHYKKVIKLFNRKTKKLIQINNFKSTENHEYYVINKEDKKKITEQNISQYAYWISAKDLIKEKHLLVKITK